MLGRPDRPVVGWIVVGTLPPSCAADSAICIIQRLVTETRMTKCLNASYTFTSEVVDEPLSSSATDVSHIKQALTTYHMPV